MERLWSLAVATSGNRWQMRTPREWLKQAGTAATGCDQLPIGAHGKGALPPWSGGGHLPGSAKRVEPGSAKRVESREPEGSQDLVRLYTSSRVEAQIGSPIGQLPPAAGRGGRDRVAPG